MGLYTEKQIASALKSLTGWKRSEHQIFKIFVKKDFVHAMGFVQSVALLAEKANHHPDIVIQWNKVTLVLSTHSAGGLTDKDFSLAKAINEL
ncbi:MAG: 4a-hydroxytetrahydrobiopterin dehydratase [Bacteroidota bacterium]|nr:4a-hydroxytetrahydrobiopterin dehydratase [Bacteroidota bacterium]